MLMDGLLIATGFTGALTLVWLVRMATRLASAGPAVSVHFGPAAGEALTSEIGRARREVLLVGDGADAAVARALVEARTRRVALDVLIDPDADQSPLADQGLQPRPASRPTAPGLMVIIDDGTVVFAAPDAANEAGGQVIVARGPVELLQSCRQHFAAFHPVGQVAPPAPVESVPVISVAPAPAAPPPSYTPPSSSPVDDLLAAVARGTTALQDEDDEVEEDDGGPPVTKATAELFARLRAEVAASGQDDSAEKAA